MHLARDVEYHGQDIIVQADIQTEGYGRRGRQWQSDQGNLYMTLVTHPCETRIVYVVALAIRCAVAKYVATAQVSCKWPNDVLINGLKIGGAILEQGHDRTLIGIGINISHHPENNVRYPATSIAQYNTNVKVDELRNEVYQQFLFWNECFKKNGFNYIRNEWEKYSYRQGKEITILLPDDKQITVKFLGLDSSGAILVEEQGKTARYFAGDFEWQEEVDDAVSN